MKKKILFRVDAGGKIGLGHFYRSWNLAIELSKNDHEIVFIHLFSEFWNEIEKFDFQHVGLDSCNPNTGMVNFCLDNNFDILYVDGIIDFEKKELAKIKEHTKIFFYQNLSNSRHLCDIYIIPSLHHEDIFFKSFDKSKTTIYRGLEYFTFNSEIGTLKPKRIQSDSKLKTIGIICGGSDPKNMMLTILKYLDFSRFNKITFNFYFGNSYLFINDIPKSKANNVKFHSYNVSQIIKSDILIAAFGVSTYEFMALGMPIISIGHMLSTTKASKWISEKTDAIVHLGLIDHLKPSVLNDTVQKMVNEVELRKNLSEKSKEIIDLRGIERIVKIINNS